MRRPNELVELRHEPLSDDAAEGHRFVLMVPVDLPVFVGHFRGAPIVPAFVELREVARRIDRVWPELGPWQGATNLKFQAPIRPGAELELRLRRPHGGDRVRFTLTITNAPPGAPPGTMAATTAKTTAGTQCATGTLVYGPSTGDESGAPS